MFEISEKPKMVERAVLVGAYQGAAERDEAASLLAELEELVRTLGVPVCERLLVPIREIQPKLLVGSGKADEIVRLVQEKNLDVIIFDNELTPGQQRNWERLAKVAVIDRQEVIIDIFAKRAQTREARLQVELARLEYSLPRLKRAWMHLGKQSGGIGGKGEGEQQLEIDKRLIRSQIDRLKEDLVLVRRRRATQRKERKRAPVPNAAIVGYTNAGKSSLLRRLTGADVLVEDKLFATLDTTTRKVALPTRQELLLTDTVGFVRRLPHGLVEAFKATLEEAVLAEFLIHLLDASHPQVFDFYETTRRVLGELGAGDKRTLTVLNKIDKVADPAERANLRRHFPDALFVSVATGEGLDELRHRMADLLSDDLSRGEWVFPAARADLMARIHREGTVVSAEYDGDSVRVLGTVSKRAAAALAPWLKGPAAAEQADQKETVLI